MRHQSLLFFAVCCFLCLVITACSDTSNFTANGIISDGNGKILYIENVGISSVETLDSVKLTSSGKFSFKKPRPEYPEFYRLKLDNQLINFSVDSTETISFIADAATFATSYTIEGSENGKAMKDITLAQLDANLEINRLRKEYENNQITETDYQQEVSETAGRYKTVAKEFIFSAPMSSAAYFALFQQIDGLLFFDLYDSEDLKAYSAVATSYNNYYPESARSKHLYNLTLQGIKVIRSQRPIDYSNVEASEVGYIEIELPDPTGKNVKLTDIAKNSPIIVNFTSYQTEWSPILNMILGEIYTNYQARGLKIYQVSLDTDLHMWRNVASNFPWTCVRDPQSAYSQAAALYNVKQLPALFLFDKAGTIVKRVEDMKTLEADVKAIL